MECVHCEQICCLKHITQHQEELKVYRDELVQEANEAYITLTEMQVNDSREELQINLNIWKERMLNRIEQIYEKLLDDVEDSFVKVTLDFEAKKKTLANEFEANISTKLDCLSRKTDFYPHELDELRLSLNDMYTRTRDARTSLIHIDYGNGNTFLLENDNSFQAPKILVQTKPNIELTLNSYYHRQFQIHFNNLTHLHFDNSDKHLLICNSEANRFELFNHEERIGGGFWSNDSSVITSIKWCSYLNTFLVLCTQSLYALNCSIEPFNIYHYSEIKPIDGNPMKYLSIQNDLMLIKHSNGTFIEYYSLKNFQLLKQWKKEEFYRENHSNISIHRIEFDANYNLAMNVEIDEEIDYLDLFSFPDLQHLRRLENCYLIVYFPLNTCWIIKQKVNTNQTHLCLLNLNGQINRLNVDQNEDLLGMKFFGDDLLIILKDDSQSIQIQLYHKL